MTHKKTDEGYPIFRSYLEEENDKPYYSVNTLSFYYEDMERKQKLIEDLAKAIAGYDQTLTGNLQAIEQQVAERFEQWDEKLKTFDGSVMDLLQEWVDDGTMDHIVDSSIVDRKLEPLTAQLADKAEKAEVRKDTATQPIDVDEMNTRTKQLFTGGAVAVVGPNAVGNENIKEKAVSSKQTTFFNVKSEKNKFDGNYIKGTLFGIVDQSFSTGYKLVPVANGTQYQARTAVIPIKPNTTYTITIYEPEKQDRMRVGTSSQRLEFLEGTPDGTISLRRTVAYAAVAVPRVTFTSAENDNFLYISPSGSGKEPRIQVEEGSQPTEFQEYYLIGRNLIEPPKSDGTQPIEEVFSVQEAKEAFIQEMNRKARQLGMNNTNFVEPAGWPSTIEHRSTPMDLIRMMVQASGYKELNEVWNKKTFISNVGGTNARPITLNSTVSFPTIENNYYIFGGKTGSAAENTPMDGFHIVLIASPKAGSYKDEVFAAVVQNSPGSTYAEGYANRESDMRKILDNALKRLSDPNATTENILASGAMVIKLPKFNTFMYQKFNFDAIFSKNAEVENHMASTTKVMSAIVLLDSGMDLNKKYSVKPSDITTGSGMVYNSGDIITLKDALYAMMLPSSNTATHFVARIVGYKILSDGLGRFN